jgi:phosphate transport system protein
MNQKCVLFLCTENAARSQMAEGLVNHRLSGQWEAFSAGTDPIDRIYPMAVQVMAELDIDISDQRPKSVDEFRDVDLDLIIAVCDKAADNCPVWMGRGRIVYMSFPDPAAAEGAEKERLQSFRQVRDALLERVLPYLEQVEGLTRSMVMPRLGFDRDLQRLREDVVELGRMVQGSLVEAVQALEQRFLDKSRELVQYDRVINDKRVSIEYDCLVLIATQQPVARDVRMLAATIDVAGELERMGDYAKGIAKISLMIGDEPLIKPLVNIPRMAEKVAAMLAQALEAFRFDDVDKARSIPLQDDEVDALYNQVYRDLLDLIIADASVIDRATYLLWVAHNLERTADRVTNICERVIFTVTGIMEELGDTARGESPEGIGPDSPVAHIR